MRKISASFGAGGADPAPDRFSLVVTDEQTAPASGVDVRSPPAEKRTIMARYVFGDELKPGDRWKRRMLTKR